MRNTAEVVREIMDRTTSTALPLPVLIVALERGVVMPPRGPVGLLREIKSRPDLFRVLDPRVGPWRRPRTLPGSPLGWRPDRWVLNLHPRRKPHSPVQARLSESLRCLGRTLDQGSATATARWSQLMARETVLYPGPTSALAGCGPEAPAPPLPVCVLLDK